MCCYTDNAVAAGTSTALKRITSSAAPKYSCFLNFIQLLIYSTRNLCYIEYFNTIGPLTTTAFEAYWKKLDKDEKKVRCPLRQFHMYYNQFLLEMDDA